VSGRRVREQQLTGQTVVVLGGSSRIGPPVVVNNDLDVIRVVEGRRAAFERGVVEVPLG
jgi:hypothetical protein